jgi:diguanylate cyclase
MAVLAETGLAPGQLELEITESVLLNHECNTIQKLNTLFSHGIRIALDDFGTGFSSLSLLKDLKISTLKIDKSFVQDPKAAALMEMMVRLGHILGTETVAEGVETEEQMRYARRLGSERVQGYLTARPMPLPALRKFIESRIE